VPSVSFEKHASQIPTVMEYVVSESACSTKEEDDVIHSAVTTPMMKKMHARKVKMMTGSLRSWTMGEGRNQLLVGHSKGRVDLKHLSR